MNGEEKQSCWLEQPLFLGLYNMHGNVWERVQDKYQSSYVGAPACESAWERDSSIRVLRGGSWSSFAWD